MGMLYHKIESFFPQELYFELQNLAIHGNDSVYMDRSAGRALDSYAGPDNINPTINDYCNNYFTDLGYTPNGAERQSQCRLQGTVPQTEYKVHQDGQFKEITLLIYIHPIEADGTIFYDEDKKYPIEDTWKPNSGYWFNREQAPYHSYRNTLTCQRWVFMYNILDRSMITIG